MKKILLIEYFKNDNKERDKEVIESITTNQSHNIFDEILVMCEKNIPEFTGNEVVNKEFRRFLLKKKISLKSNRRGGRDINKKFIFKENNIKYIFSEKRQTFKSMFEYANKHYPNSIVVIANNDIYFDTTLNLLDNYNMDNKCFSLLRYDVQEDKKTSKIFEYCDFELARGYGTKGPRADAQDSWIFKTPISIPSTCNFNFGILGCDNRLAYLLHKEGYIVSNPAIDIKSHHLHLTGIRTYDKNKRLISPYLYICPTKLNEVGKYKFAGL